VNRTHIDDLARQFADLHHARIETAKRAGDAYIYQTDQRHETDLWPISVGTYLIRSAAIVEQTFNGITTRLWDDPFEWTLPERLPTVDDLVAYFEEVEAARIRGFGFLRSDDDLSKSIPAPVALKTLDQLLTETIGRSTYYLSQAKSLLSNN
jgi:hypothetical protein